MSRPPLLPFHRPCYDALQQAGTALPHHPSERMVIVPTDEYDRDRAFMRIALEEAARAPVIGEVPIAAMVVRGDQVLAQAHNYRELWQDPTAHAEIIAIRAAATTLGSWRLTGTTLYVTVEPCSMCIGAIILARVSRVVFGAYDPKAGACGSVFNLPSEPRLNHQVAVTGGILQQESQLLIQRFFKQLREASLSTNPFSTQ